MNTPASPSTVALLGTGRMGLPMATRLCQAGFTVHAWNRNRAKAEPLAALGAQVHDQATEAVRGADIVISMLENGPVVEQVLFGLGTAQAMKPGALVVDMASIKPAEARDHAARLQAAYTTRGVPDDHTLYLKAHDGAPYATVLRAVDSAREIGVLHVTMITDAPRD